MSRARAARLAVRVLSYAAALAVFLWIEGIWLALLGFFGVWFIGTAIGMWVFARLATPEERKADLRERAASTE